MLHLKITTLRFPLRPNPKFCSLSSLLKQMNKKRTIKQPNKAVKTTTPRKAIKKSATSTTITAVQPKSKSRAKPSSHFQRSDEIVPRISISSVFLDRYSILSPDFYQLDALELAPRLLGKHLKKDDVILQITEVEAYRQNDSACHGRFGITARTAPVFGPGGHAYIYLCYGLHTMLNVVADKEGIGAAVLIRSCAPVTGLETIQQRRGLKSEKPILLTGPGKVGQALGISTEWSNHPLFTPGGLELLDGAEPKKIVVGPRVGIEYALPEHVNAPWRFAIADSPWISAPKNTLRPPQSSESDE
ncbi:3-methyladenine DNA glycosylase [Handroanthus impetiginosus]|uniref:DNA-3-methyladenine glycosylase II n=1 Tax=Handroanthus impetiginosus TaxID=429701 RepID=A0A2G9FXL2_9LAMI|nr:3-methyladenine DNA glycosylase [Handroanthus impetiginosus]